MHILDITENSTRAGARRIDMKLEEDHEADLLILEISDDGAGMDPEALSKIGRASCRERVSLNV